MNSYSRSHHHPLNVTTEETYTRLLWVRVKIREVMSHLTLFNLFVFALTKVERLKVNLQLWSSRM